MNHGGSSPDEKKSVRRRMRSSDKAHDKKIDALLAKKAVMSSVPDDDEHIPNRHSRVDNHAEILVLNTSQTAADDARHHFVAYCRTHDTESRRFTTEQQATKAAYESEKWCAGCAPMSKLSTRAKSRAAKI